MFATPNMTVLGGRGFSVGGGEEVLKTAAGYPVTLEKTSAKPPESITVFGNSGGVGDYDSTKQAYRIPIILSDGTASKTINLYSDAGLLSYTAHNLMYGASWVMGELLMLDGSTTTGGAHQTTNNYIKVEPSTTYYLRYSLYVDWRRPSAYRYDAETGKYVFTRNFHNSSPNELMLYTAANETHIRITAHKDDNKVLLVKSPIALDYFANDMLIYDELAVSAKSRTAERVQRVTANGIISPKTTDVAALQDFVGQDWKLPKSRSLNVTAGTTAAPGSMEIAYYGKK